MVGLRRFLFLVLLVAWGISPASAETCSRDDFAKVVGDAANTLKALNDEKARTFQAKLRELKAKRGWTHDQFMKEAAPLVRDDRIAAFDEETNAILAKINNLGEGGEGQQPDCKLLGELKVQMADLVRITQAKWAYMFGKVAAALN